LPCAIASIAILGPVAASPPANTPSTFVSKVVSLTAIVPLLVFSSS
jgi:hypothetical protein